MGPNVPLEGAGHNDRLRIFRSAVFYCLNDADLADILDTQLMALHLYVRGIFQAAFRVLHYELPIATRTHFELNVFKPAIKNEEIQ